MKKKNAFTLIELLAVLVILAVIALIVFPLIGDVINDSKKKAFLRSVDGLEHAVDLDYQKDYYTGVREYSYANGNLTLNSVKGESRNNNIKVEGIIENGVGTISVDKSGNTSLIIHNDEYCATKSYDDKTITVEEKTDDNCSVAIAKTFKDVMESLVGTEVNNNDPDNNLRYVGSTPNNYVLFNKERWRIIGLFNDVEKGNQIKIIRDEPYNNSIIQWDSNNSNNWLTASLNILLNDPNTGYIKSIQNNDPISYSYIDLKHIWNIGGTLDYESATRSDFYHAERSNVISDAMTSHLWEGAIGLMYPSDYGYASGGVIESCNSVAMNGWFAESIKKECTEKSWLYDSEYNQWTLTPYTDSTEHVYGILSGGAINGYSVSFGIYLEPFFDVMNVKAKPVLYLKSDTKIIGGKGTYDEPYELGV